MNPFLHDVEPSVKQILVSDESHSQEHEGIDPLDAFMANLAEGAVTVNHARYEFEDEVESSSEEFFEKLKTGRKGLGDFCTEEKSNTDEGNHSKRSIEGIEPFDHTSVVYTPFKRDFYEEHPSITTCPSSDISALRKSMGISVTGSQIPKCVCSFAHFNLPEAIMSVLRYNGFTNPTPIQAQAIPCALSGRNVLGLAMTGSGKTMAYVIPAVIHVLGNEPAKNPRVLIICPTRELAIQIEQEIYRFVKKSGDQFTSLALTGGLSKFEQFKQLSKGCDIIVGNPGRMIDLIQMKRGLDLTSITMCVFDEADRMFKMGFENQLRTIIQRIRPDRQVLMFSATMPPRIEKLAREIMDDPIRVVVGSIGQASSVIDQNVFVCHSDDEKYVWLQSALPKLIHEGGRIILFVNTRSTCEELVKRIKTITAITCNGIHGDLEQGERMRTMNDFRSGKCSILVATDVAARGIDIQGINCVVEFDAAKDFDTHTHRIGRTGRAGMAGKSWTLLEEHQSKLAAHIAESIEALGKAYVPEDLMKLALKHGPFREARIVSEKDSKKKSLNIDEDTTKWEPLNKHFKAGQSETLQVQDDVDTTEVKNDFASGIHERFGKISKLHHSDT
jgi:ATP-dependent RNA helicase DDX42